MKNKEIEELLNELKQHLEYQREVSDIDGNVAYLRLTIKEYKLLLSYIEQLENNKEKEYVLVGRMQLKTRDYIHQLEKEKRQLENNIDKAIEYNKNILKENWYGGYEKENAQKNIDILKGGSDE